MVHDLSARADEAAAGPWADGDGDVVEGDVPGRLAHEAGLGKRGPCGRSVRSRVAVTARGRRRGTSSLRHLRAEMRGIPLHRAQRVLVIHVDMIEALDRSGLRVFDHRAVWAAQVAETAFARRL